MARWRKLAPREVDIAVTDGVVMLDFLPGDDDTETPQRFAVMSIPTLIRFHDGHEVARLDGLIRDEDLERALEEDKEE